MPMRHHPRLTRQLAELGLDPDAGLDPAALARLLESVDRAYAEADGSRRTLEIVLDTLDSATCHTDGEGRLVGINDPGLEMFGVEARQLLDRPLMETVHLEDDHGARLTQDSLRGPLDVARGRVVRADGSSAAVEISVSPIAPDRGDRGTVVRVRDIGERLAREQELHEARVEALVARRAEQAKGLFLANLSHELRTPLNAIVGYSEMLLEEATEEGAEQRVGDLLRIQAAGHHLTQLIGAVLDLSKIDAGRMELFPEDVDLLEVVREARDAVLPQAIAKGLEVELAVKAPPPPALFLDKTRVRQCVLNLVSNAVKFTDEGCVTVEVDADGERARVRVHDSGIGISAAGLERLFDEFVQVDDAVRRGGTGLGLALSRRLSRMMGGDIHAGSELGRGSTFVLELPLAPAAAEAPAVTR